MKLRAAALAVCIFGSLGSPGGARAGSVSQPGPASEPAGLPAQTLAQSPAWAAERRPAVSVHAGWWSVEAEWRTKSGAYAAAGVPWAAAALYLMNGASWVVPLGARAGYDLALSPRWSLRASAHAASAYGDERGKCGCADAEPTFRLFLFAEAGVRYQSPGGLVFGVDLPLYGLRPGHDQFPPPVSLAFTQLYLGYSWGR
jgi:hypothetical protein